MESRGKMACFAEKEPNGRMKMRACITIIYVPVHRRNQAEQSTLCPLKKQLNLPASLARSNGRRGMMVTVCEVLLELSWCSTGFSWLDSKWESGDERWTEVKGQRAGNKGKTHLNAQGENEHDRLEVQTEDGRAVLINRPAFLIPVWWQWITCKNAYLSASF